MSDFPFPFRNLPPAGCSGPCRPEAPCAACRSCWQELVSRGFWDEVRQRWSDESLQAMACSWYLAMRPHAEPPV
ncbi:MAG: hypothetical protein AB1634_09305 [Thermodesulfobacteriota bacterium]